ncbi:hypothetical protein AK51_08285 [Serratia nematodiphila DZ0503SBS1]|nr:hypothetical protein AK51_08285 [Serratia nematodiphila DZ0503SBS1]
MSNVYKKTANIKEAQAGSLAKPATFSSPLALLLDLLKNPRISSMSANLRRTISSMFHSIMNIRN